jgi:hypothetical protein
MMATPVSAGPFTKNFGTGEAELWSNSNISMEIDDIQDWYFDDSEWKGEQMYVQVTSKWIDKTTNAEDFNITFVLEVIVYSEGYPGPTHGSDSDTWIIDDNSGNHLNDQWFSQNLACGPFPPDASGVCVYECWFIGDIWNYDQETHENDIAHWFIYCVP